MHVYVITKYARIIVLGPHLTNMVPFQSHNSFSQPKLSKSHCEISHEPCLFSVRTLSSPQLQIQTDVRQPPVSLRVCVRRGFRHHGDRVARRRRQDALHELGRRRL